MITEIVAVTLSFIALITGYFYVAVAIILVNYVIETLN